MSLSGEKLEDNEVDEVVKDCMDPEDDDGMIPYAREYRIGDITPCILNPFWQLATLNQLCVCSVDVLKQNVPCKLNILLHIEHDPSYSKHHPFSCVKLHIRKFWEYHRFYQRMYVELPLLDQ